MKDTFQTIIACLNIFLFLNGALWLAEGFEKLAHSSFLLSLCFAGIQIGWCLCGSRMRKK